MNYDPSNWYWLADDGRLYASSSQTLVNKTDDAYVAWSSAGSKPTPWPQDENGEQSNAALQEVLSPYGRFVDLAAYAASKRYSVETGGYTFNGHPIATDRDSQGKITSVAVAATTVGSSFSTEWKCVDGTFLTLNHDDAISMATAVMIFVSNCFATEASVVGAITAGTTTTMAAIDSADWPTGS
ncbi:DUF4376 domain-containing protein [Rhizobium rhizogenes]|uniref:DUF4376 domain-containing protein n=1 Tax=Rhizobium rhizogenes TaxID=359 RepID=UPI0015725610|nr:DUF4376 domain-containing protein [Rhizobium rhizogenes]NTI27680.1 DUF4376 domain-containing protein [Rhizobium rhizogenes]